MLILILHRMSLLYQSKACVGSEQLARNAGLAYMRRAYLLTGDLKRESAEVDLL